MIFYPWGYYIKNNQTVELFGEYYIFVTQWYIQLFLFIAGAATWFALSYRTREMYIRERIKRLLIPLIFGILVIAPPMVFFERTQDSDFQGSYIEFYPHLFEGIYPDGNFGVHHLYFIFDLFIFSLLMLPIFLFLRKERGTFFIIKLRDLCNRRGIIFLLFIPIVIIRIAIGLIWSPGQDFIEDFSSSHPLLTPLEILDIFPKSYWINFLVYLIFFIYGYLIFSDMEFEQLIHKNGKTALVLGISSMILILSISWFDKTPDDAYSKEYVLYQTLRGFNNWISVIAILYLGRRFLNFYHTSLNYINEATYPIYILHQTVIVTLGFYIVQWKMGMIEKFFIIFTTSSAITLLTYHFLIRQTNLTRFLFGMRPKKIKSTK